MAFSSDEQPVLRRDVGGNGLRPDAIAALPEAHGAHDIDGGGTVDPSGEIAGVAGGQIVTARQDGHARAAEAARSSTRSVRLPHAWQETTRSPGRISTSSRAIARTPRGRRASARPPPARRGAFRPTGDHFVDRERSRRRVVQEDQDLGEQAMAGAEVDDAAAAEQPAHAPRGLPRFVQFFSRQAAGMADGARHAMEKRRARESDPDRDR